MKKEDKYMKKEDKENGIQGDSDNGCGEFEDEHR